MVCVHEHVALCQRWRETMNYMYVCMPKNTIINLLIHSTVILLLLCSLSRNRMNSSGFGYSYTCTVCIKYSVLTTCVLLLYVEPVLWDGAVDCYLVVRVRGIVPSL